VSARCDFCSANDPEWFYPAGDFEVAEHAWGSSGGWAACADCSDLLEKRLNERLVRERMMVGALAGAMMDAGVPGMRLTKSERRYVEDQTWRLFNRFLTSRRGPRRLFG